MIATAPFQARELSSSVCERIVCGIDETPESLEAALQAARLRAPGGSLVLVAVADIALAAQAGWAAVRAADQIWHACEEALRRAEALAQPTSYRIVKGRPYLALLGQIERERATLVALGTHGHRRAAGLSFGTVGTTVLRDAPRSVLVARPQPSGGGPPRRIVLGVDGSPQAAGAAAVARELGARFDAELRVVTGLGGKPVDVAVVSELYPDAELDPRPPVDAIVDRSEAADLLVVGSRGLHGWRALGSVSERVAHQARCSVLVVRGLDTVGAPTRG